MKDASDEASDGEPRLLRFWIDAQLPPSLAVWLRGEQGADATHVQDLDILTAGDPVIFAEAARNGAVVVTKDGDFPKLVQQHGPPPQVLWIRSGNVTNRELRRIVLEVWPEAIAVLEDGAPLVEIRRRHFV
jgi:predicted nuclease of predicted toxin-antitoxin system